jgi:hypothetical protein
MPSEDRDQKFERALAQHLRGGSAQANCPDAETLAAYHERNLSLEEMALWKQHISACEACQEALALVETTENQLAEDWENREIPVHEAVSIRGADAARIPKLSAKADASTASEAAATPVAINRRRPALLRWAIPLGAVAAGVLVFIGIYEQRKPKVARYADTVIARRQEPAASGPILDQYGSKVQPKPETKELDQETGEISQEKIEPKFAAAQPAKPMAKTKDLDEEARTFQDQLAGGRFEKKTSMPPSPVRKIPLQAPTDTVVSENAPVAAPAPRPAPPPAPLALGGSAGGAVAQRAQAHADAKSVVPSVTQTVTVESEAAAPDASPNAMMMKQGVSNGLVQVARSDATGLILTPDPKVFWKLQPAGTLQLTTDGGKKWKLLDTGANVDLTGGFAPSPRICWIAGKAGTLLLTTDRGGHWTRISTPITGDLGGVHASDARHASIWDAANHASYETSDSGATWKQTSSK